VQYAYAYDAENRICAIKMSNAYKIYVYDADGNRIAKGNITPQGTPPPNVSMCSPLKNNFSITQAYAINLGGNEIENYTPGQSWHNTNVYNGGTLIATYAGNYMSIPMTDWQGTRRAQLRNNQAMSGVMDFLSLPYGDGFTMVGGTSFDSLVQYTGQQYNQEDNLYNFKARYLGDWVGRFMSPDYADQDDGPQAVPYFNPSNPQSLNLYGFVNDNPFSQTDPDGHDVQVCTPYGAGGQDCKTIPNDQYAAAQQAGNGGLNVPTLDQVGMNGNGSGKFYATNITDANGNVVGTATYVPEDEHTDYYANRIGYGIVATASRGVTQVTAVAGAVYSAAGGAAVIGGAGGLTTLGSLASDLTVHSEEAALLARHGITPAEARAAIEAAKKAGTVVEAMGRYGPQLRYDANGIRVVVATTGRNAGKIITAFFK
jgi:RHS repeat-associated protein